MTDNCTARTLAGSLLDIGAVLLRPDEPFEWASGWHSPLYCDNRRILSSPSLRSEVAEAFAALIVRKYPGVEVVAGVATGAIAEGVLVADRLGKPFVYVRSKPKDHGTRSLIEGTLPPGAKTVVVEDLVSTGMSSLAAVDALREAGAQVLGMTAVFTYGFPIAAERFEQKDIALDTLSDYEALLEEATARGLLSPDQVAALAAWREAPESWGR